jgi:TDG/mug DNA glycosylase family protein
MRVYSFPAVVGTAPRILILGSMPGVASLDASEYYAHPRNQFWRIVMTLCGTDAQLSYEERLRVLRDHGLALWDVLHSCVRPGSLDASIEHRSAKPNDLMALLRRTGSIRRLCCNGAAAGTRLTVRHLQDTVADLF